LNADYNLSYRKQLPTGQKRRFPFLIRFRYGNGKKTAKKRFSGFKNVLGFENPFSRRIDGKTLPFSGNAIRIRVFGNVNLFSSIVLSGW
jgi:hypothetical protein